MSWNLSVTSRRFCTSLVVGKDAISRLSFNTVKRMVDEMVVCLARYAENMVVSGGRPGGCCCGGEQSAGHLVARGVHCVGREEARHCPMLYPCLVSTTGAAAPSWSCSRTCCCAGEVGTASRP